MKPLEKAYCQQEKLELSIASDPIDRKWVGKQ